MITFLSNKEAAKKFTEKLPNVLNTPQTTSQVVFLDGTTCTLTRTKKKDKGAPPRYIWGMTSNKTGYHQITTAEQFPDDRVLAHWDGFITNNAPAISEKLNEKLGNK